MNRIIKSVAIGVALGCAVLWCFPVALVAKQVQVKVNAAVASGGNWGGDYKSSYAALTPTFRLPSNVPVTIWTEPDRDSTAGWNDADTVHFYLLTAPDNYREVTGNGEWKIVKRWSVAAGGYQGTRSFTLTLSPRNSNVADSTASLLFSSGVGRFAFCGPDNDSLADGAFGVNFFLTYDDGK